MGLWSDIFGSKRDTDLGRQIGDIMLKHTLESRHKDVFKIPTWNETLDVEKYSRLVYKTAIAHNMGRGQINRMVAAMASQMEYNGLPHNRVRPFHRQIMEIVMQYVNNPPTEGPLSSPLLGRSTPPTSDVPPIEIGDFFDAMADIDANAKKWIETIAHALREYEPPIQTQDEAKRFCVDYARRIGVPAFVTTKIATYAMNLASHLNRQEAQGR